MRTQFDNQLKELNVDMLKMASYVEESINKAISALKEKNVVIAREAILFDDTINDMEKQIEHRCLKLLLQQQPVAQDLRRISTALKMITDMERIGDQASDISEIVIHLANRNSSLSNSYHIQEMAKATAKMLKASINAYVNSDLEMANYVIKEDDHIDSLFDTVKLGLVELIRDDKSIGEQALDILMIAKYFERIGDHAVNIAEWVVFSITGVHKNMKIM